MEHQVSVEKALPACWSGVSPLASLRDGSSFTGRLKRVARRLGEQQSQRDDELFAAHGGRARVFERLMAKWRDSAASLASLTAAEERLMLMTAVERGVAVTHVIDKVNEVVGFGVFAAAPIRPREVIGEYVGVLRKYQTVDASNAYLALTPAYGKYDGFIIDGRTEGNFTRFINHSGRAPNISNEFVFHRNRWHRILRADRFILPGEQLLWDYGAEYWRHREAPADL